MPYTPRRLLALAAAMAVVFARTPLGASPLRRVLAAGGVAAGAGVLALALLPDLADAMLYASGWFGGGEDLNMFSSQIVDLNGELLFDEPFTLTDLGGNLCGCDGQQTACQILSSGLAAPDPM